jgi:hypothetical protein
VFTGWLAASPAFERIGLEADPMSKWFVRGLAEHNMTAVLMETRQVQGEDRPQ